jgi:hypothetical protein
MHVTANSVEGGDLDNVPTSSSWPVHASSHVSPHYNNHPMYFQTSAASPATAALTAATASITTTASSSAATPYTPRNNALTAASGSTSISDAQLAAVAGYMPASATAAATAAAARKKLEEDGAWKLKEWPPARGYTLSCWVYVHHYGDAGSTVAGSRRRSSAGVSTQQQQQQQGGCMPLTLLEMQGEGHSASSPLSITRIEIVPLTGGSAGDGGVLRVSVDTYFLSLCVHEEIIILLAAVLWCTAVCTSHVCS